MDYFCKEYFHWDYRTSMFNSNFVNCCDEKIKQNYVYKGLVKNTNNYPYFFTPKIFSNINTSILSYIVGNFVGSKSQININNKNHFSYDLSAVISNLLNPWKCESQKTSYKKIADNIDKIFSKMNQEFYDRYMIDNPNYECKYKKSNFLNMCYIECLFALPLENLNKSDISFSFNENYSESDLENNNKNIFNSLLIKRFINQEICDINQVNYAKKSSQGPISKNNKPDLALKTHIPNNLAKKFNVNCEEFPKKSAESELIITEDKFDNKFEVSFSNSYDHLECYNMSAESLTGYSNQHKKGQIKHFKNYLATERFRQQSECSNESTDSDSFIIFEDGFDDNDASKSFKIKSENENEIDNVGDNYNNEDNDVDDYDDDDDDDDDYEDDDDDDDDDIEYSDDGDNEYNIGDNENEYGNSRYWKHKKNCFKNNNNYEQDFFSLSKSVLLANTKWSENYNDALDKNKSRKKVKFCDKIVVNQIIAWDYAYRTARLGPWEQLARDRVRFHERITRLSLVISPILKLEHRNRIYKELHS